MWPSLSAVQTAIKGAETSHFTRDLFEQCISGLGILDLAVNEVMALDLLKELTVTREGLLEAGIGGFIGEFTAAVSLHDALLQVKNPETAAEMTLFSQSALEVLENYDASKIVFTQAQDLNVALTSEFSVLRQKLEASPLLNHPAFVEAQAHLVETNQGNVLTQNIALGQNIAIFTALLDRLEAGLVVLCNFDLYPMRVYELASGQFRASAELIEVAAEQDQLAIDLTNTAATSFCLSDHPVTYAEMQTFKAGLSSRQTSIRREIELVTASSEGYAQNISFWLASKFAQSVGSLVGQDVCVSPALASTFARTTLADSFLVHANGELFSDECGGANGVSKRVVISGQSVNRLNIGCVSDTSRRPMLTFRLAAGKVCN